MTTALPAAMAQMGTREPFLPGLYKERVTKHSTDPNTSPLWGNTHGLSTHNQNPPPPHTPRAPHHPHKHQNEVTTSAHNVQLSSRKAFLHACSENLLYTFHFQLRCSAFPSSVGQNVFTDPPLLPLLRCAHESIHVWTLALRGRWLPPQRRDGGEGVSTFPVVGISAMAGAVQECCSYSSGLAVLLARVGVG